MVPCSCDFSNGAGLAWVGELALPLLSLLPALAEGGTDASDGGVFSAGSATDPPGDAGETAGEEPLVGSAPVVFGSGAFWHADNMASTSPVSTKVVLTFMKPSSIKERSRYWRAVPPCRNY